MKLKLICVAFLLLIFSSCNYVEDIANDAAMDAAKECPTQDEIEWIVDDSFEYYREQMKNDMRDILKEFVTGVDNG